MPELPTKLVPNNVSYYEYESTHWESYWDEESKSVKGNYVAHEANTIVEQYYTTVIDDSETKSSHTNYRYAHFKLTIEDINTATERVTKITDLDSGKEITLPNIGEKLLSRNDLMGRLVRFYISMRNSCDIYGIYLPFRQSPVGHSVTVQFVVPQYIDQDLQYTTYNDIFQSYQVLSNVSTPNYKFCQGTDERYAHTEAEAQRGYWYCYPVICVLNTTDPNNPFSVFCNAVYNSEGKLVVKGGSTSISVGYLPPGKYRVQWIFTGATLYPRSVTVVEFEVLDLRLYDYFYQNGYGHKNSQRNLIVQIPVFLERLYYHLAYDVTQEQPEFVPVCTFELPTDSDFPDNTSPDSGYYGNRQFAPDITVFNNNRVMPDYAVLKQKVIYRKGITANNFFISQLLTNAPGQDTNSTLSNDQIYYQGAKVGEYDFSSPYESWDGTIRYVSGSTVQFGYWKFPDCTRWDGSAPLSGFDISWMMTSGRYPAGIWYSSRYVIGVSAINRFSRMVTGATSTTVSPVKSSTAVTDLFDGLQCTMRQTYNWYEDAVIEGWNGSNVYPNSTSTDGEYKIDYLYNCYYPYESVGVGYDLNSLPADLAQMQKDYQKPTPFDNYLDEAISEKSTYNGNNELPMGSKIRVSQDYNRYFCDFSLGISLSELMGINDPTERVATTQLYSTADLQINPYEITKGQHGYDIKYNNDYPKDIPQTEYHPITGSVDWTGYEHHVNKACWVEGYTSSSIGRPTAMQVGPDIYIPHQ